MTIDELKNLVKKVINEKCEGQNIEVKAAKGGTPQGLYNTLSSFSNQDGGGIILFGIDEDDDFAICGVKNVQELQSNVVEQGKQMEPVVRPLFTNTIVDGKSIVSAEIAGVEYSQRPVFYKGIGRLKGSYIRSGDSDNVMTEYEVYSYEAFRKMKHDDLAVCERASIEDFDEALIAEYLLKLRLVKPKLMGIAQGEVLKLQGITVDGKPTLAGMLLFGKFPQSFYPQLSITAMVTTSDSAFKYSGETRFIDNQRIEGTIPEMLELCLSFVRRNMKVSTAVDKDGKRVDKEEYPLLAVRELILNSLVHRDYSIYNAGTPIRLIMFRDRLEIVNPGGIYGGKLTINTLGKEVGETRNSFIANILEILIGSENRFTGIPTVFSAMADAKLPAPQFLEQRGEFTAILKNGLASVVLTAAEAQLLVFCRRPKTREQIAEHLKINSVKHAVSEYIKPLVAKGLLKLTNPKTPRSHTQQYYSE